MHDFPVPNIADIGALIVILLGIFLGLRRGLSGILAGFVGTVVALVLGIYCYGPLGVWIVKHTSLSEAAAHTAAFSVVVLGVMIVTLLLRIVLRSIMKVSFEGNIERVGGGIAGFIQSVAIVLIIFVLMNTWPSEYLNRVFGRESLAGSLVVKFMPAVKEKVEKLPVGEKIKKIRKEMAEPFEEKK
jgi:uncharacterized membrane protein required for colicin V production